MRQMVQSVLESDELPKGLQQLIAGKAEGNPLFIEEVVRSLLEEEDRQRRSGRAPPRACISAGSTSRIAFKTS